MIEFSQKKDSVPEFAKVVKSKEDNDFLPWSVRIGAVPVDHCPDEEMAKESAARVNLALSKVVVPKEEFQRLKAAADKMAEALNQLYTETADYILINHLGDVHHNKSMKDARKALAAYQEAGKK